MNKTPSLAPSQESSGNVRNAATETAGAVSRLVLNVSRLRRNSKVWAMFRVFLGIAGAALVVFPVGLANNYYYAVAGLVMFIAAILLPPAAPTISIEDKARELGALVVVDGGRLVTEGSSSAPVQLFVGAERILALDGRLQPLLVVPARELRSAFAEEYGGHWILSITWAGQAAQFSYRGMSAEDRAHAAETALRSVMLAPLPEIPRTRAANA